MTLITQRRQRDQRARNVLNAITDPDARRWRVVAVDGVEPRLNDFEVLKTLSNGAVLHVEKWGDTWIDWTGATIPTPGAPVTQAVTITVEANDGPVLHAATDGTPLWRGGGTRLTAAWTVDLRGYARTWAPTGSAFSLDMTNPALTTPASTAADGGATLQASARGYSYIQSIADAAGGAVTAAGAGTLRADTAPPQPFYYLPIRMREAVRFSLLARQGLQQNADEYKVRQWLHLSSPVTAQTVLAVVRRGSTGSADPFLAGPAGATHWLRFANTTGFSYGSATATSFIDGRSLAATIGDAEWVIVAVRFNAPLAWEFINANDAAGTSAATIDIRELHFMPGAVSDADIQRWMGYAAHRHDLAHKLPFNHLYRWGAPGFETPATNPTPLPAVIRFGRLTRAGAGGWPLPYGDAHVLGGTDAALFTVSEGMLVPAASGLAAGPFSITVDGAAVSVETAANVAHVRSSAEMSAAETALRGTTATIRWRSGRFAQGQMTNGGYRVSAGTTLTIDTDAPRRSVFTRFSVSGFSTATSPGNVVVTGIRCHDDDARPSILSVRTSGTVTVRDCEAHGDWLNPATNYFVTYHDRGGAFSVEGTTQTILELSELHNVNVGGAVSCKTGEAFNRYNFIYGRFGDGITGNDSGDDTSGRRWVHDNLYRDSYGRVEYYSKPHCDVLQMRLTASDDSTSVTFGAPPVSLITVQRNIVWQSLDNLTSDGSARRGERGVYIEGSNGNYGQHSGVISGNIFFGRHETGIDCNGGNSEAVVAKDNSLIAPDGGSVSISQARVQDRNVAHRIAQGSAFRSEIFAGATDGMVEVEGVDLTTIYSAATRRVAMGPHDIIAALTPLAAGPLDLGGGASIGAVTMAGALKPLVTVFPPGRPAAPPGVSLSGSNIVVTLPADPADLSGLPVTRRDVRIAPTNDINNGSEPNWRTFTGFTSGGSITADSPGDPNYVRWRVVTSAGPGPWSMVSASVTPPAVTGTSWTPASVTRIAHYDASNAGSLTKTGSTVTAVGNLAGGAGGLTATGTNTHGTRLLNGLPVFDCSTTAAFLGGGLTLPGEHLFAFVFSVDLGYSGASNNDAVFHIGDTNRYELYSGGNSTSFFGKTKFANLTSNDAPAGSILPGNYFSAGAYAIAIAQFSRDGSKLTYFVNGVLTSSLTLDLLATDVDDNPVTTIPVNAVGIWRNASTGLLQPKGAWAEAVMVSGVSAATRRRLEGYLAHKWGLTAQLPADHPYKAVAP